MDGVTAVPMVANVGYNEIAQGGKIKVQFIATRTMADGYTYIDSGFFMVRVTLVRSLCSRLMVQL